jgi:hypothetical protein
MRLSTLCGLHRDTEHDLIRTCNGGFQYFSNFPFIFKWPLKLINNPLWMLTNPFFHWKPASVKLASFKFPLAIFQKLSLALWPTVSQYLCPNFLFPFGWMCSFSWFPMVAWEALDALDSGLCRTFYILMGNLEKSGEICQCYNDNSCLPAILSYLWLLSQATRYRQAEIISQLMSTH